MALRRLLPPQDVTPSPPPAQHLGAPVTRTTTLRGFFSRFRQRSPERVAPPPASQSVYGMRLRSTVRERGGGGWARGRTLNASNNAHMEEGEAKARPEMHDCAVQVRIARPDSPALFRQDANLNSPQRHHRSSTRSRASSGLSLDIRSVPVTGQGITFQGANIPHMYGLDYDQDDAFSADGTCSRDNSSGCPLPATASRSSGQYSRRTPSSEEDLACSPCEYLKWFVLIGVWQLLQRHKNIVIPLIVTFVLLTSLHCLWPIVAAPLEFISKTLNSDSLPPFSSMLALPFLTSFSANPPPSGQPDSSSPSDGGSQPSLKGCDSSAKEALEKCLTEQRRLKEDVASHAKTKAEADCQVEQLRVEVEQLRVEGQKDRAARVAVQRELASVQTQLSEAERVRQAEGLGLKSRHAELLQDLLALRLAQGSVSDQHSQCCRNLTDKVTDTVNHVFDQREAEKTNKPISKSFFGSPSPSDAHVLAIVEEALAKYSADKTGMADYALESAGGSVITARTSETYDRRTWLYSAFGIPLWYSYNTARTVISPEVLPGQCWSIAGSSGQLMLQLAKPITITGVTLEHIPKVLSPSGSITSAPKDFSVSGFHTEQDTEGVLLGNFTYIEDGKPIQYFPIKGKDAGAFCYLEVSILSNHGNPDYTCLYRVRVHGQPKTA